jgi:lipoate---protein ligase
LRKVYISTSTDPYVNLALEEMLFEKITDQLQILFLWQNEKTVVIGQNQNPWKECNLFYLNKIDGNLVRRKSGGGAVYHDLGNLNFTFLSKHRQETIEENLNLIISLLKSFEIHAVFQGRNDLLVDGAKISGNAFYVEYDTICHHGTLLVDVDFTKLAEILTVSHKKLESKGVDSIRARVSNLTTFNPDITVDQLIHELVQLYLYDEKNKKPVEFLNGTCDDLSSKLQKYRSWSWNFGQSPTFEYEFNQKFNWGEVTIGIETTNGCISNLSVHTDAMDVSRADAIRKVFLGMPFNPEKIETILEEKFGR